MKLNTLFAGFLDDCSKKGRAYGTIVSHKYNIDFTIGPLLGEREFKSLRLVDVSSLIEGASSRGISSSRKTVITFTRILFYARACGYKLPFDPRDIEVPRAQRLRETVALTDEEIVKIRLALDPKKYKPSKHLAPCDYEKTIFAIVRRRALFEFLLHTGLRIAEALTVNKEQIDFNDQEFRIRNVKTGTFAPVYFYGAEKSIKDYLAIRTDSNPALFTNFKGERLSQDTAHSCMIRMAKRIREAGVKKHVNHKILRTTFVTRLLLNGCDPKEVQKLARHTSLQTTLGYYYAVDDKRLKPKHRSIIGKL
jgi:integrase